MVNHTVGSILILLLSVNSFNLIATGDEIKRFSSENVLDYIRTAALRNVSEICRRSLLMVEPLLNAHDTLQLQKEYFINSYAVGEQQSYLNRDRSRWHYRFMECIHAAGESVAVASEYPMIFCSGRIQTNGTIGGICLPSPCTNDRDELLRVWNEKLKGGKDIEVEDVECTRSRYEKQWYEIMSCVLEFSSNKVLMCIVAFATIYHIQRGDQANSLFLRLFLAFSAKSSIQSITSFPKDENATIKCIVGLRVLATIWVIAGHTSIFIEDFLANPRTYEQRLGGNFMAQVITNCFLSIDIFFVLSATLTSFHWFRQCHRSSGQQADHLSMTYWLRFYRHRIFRLWPSYLYVLFVLIFRYSHSHSHPMWSPNDQGIMCRKNWWKNVLFINSATDNLCMPWTWYIGTEFIFFLITPIFLLSLKRSFSLGLLISIACIFASVALNLKTSIDYNFPPTQMLWTKPAIFNQDFMQHHRLVYIKPQYRIGPYLIGLLLGYILTLPCQHNQKYTKKFICIGWTLAVVFALSSLFGLYPALQGWKWPIYHLIYGATHRLVWALAMGWIIYACHNRIGGLIDTILSSRIFLPFAGLGYSTYLTHLIVTAASFNKASFPIVYHNSSTLLKFIVPQIIGSYFVGACTMLLVEQPALRIERIVLQSNTENNNIKMNSIPSEANAKLIAN